MSTVLRSVGFLDVLSSMPAESSRRAPRIHARLRRLATKPCEKSGLLATKCDGRLRLSGPLFDRIDRHIQVPAGKYKELARDEKSGEGAYSNG
jgi:hypothetical protein